MKYHRQLEWALFAVATAVFLGAGYWYFSTMILPRTEILYKEYAGYDNEKFYFCKTVGADTLNFTRAVNEVEWKNGSVITTLKNMTIYVPACQFSSCVRANWSRVLEVLFNNSPFNTSPIPELLLSTNKHDQFEFNQTLGLFSVFGVIYDEFTTKAEALADAQPYCTPYRGVFVSREDSRARIAITPNTLLSILGVVLIYVLELAAYQGIAGYLYRWGKRLFL